MSGTIKREVENIDDFELLLVAMGLMTEDERIKNAYARIHRDALNRSFFGRRRP